MHPRLFLLLASATLGFAPLAARPVGFDPAGLQPVGVAAANVDFQGRSAVRVTKSPAIAAFDEPTFVRLAGPDFRDGTIEVDVQGRLLPDAPDFARGFIGLAFRIAPDNARFESIYLRPANGRSADPVRRARATQYFSYPDFKFDRLRREAPGRYESGADVALDRWIALKLVVRGGTARLYLDGAAQPVLFVPDLKHGPEAAGAVGLWVDVGTEGYFANLRIRRS